jgi:Cu/Zn superoxide dismutase
MLIALSTSKQQRIENTEAKGRAGVVPEFQDDLGFGGDVGSRAVGNVGPRLACGTIYKVH